MCIVVLAVLHYLVASDEPIEATKNLIPEISNYRQGDACPAKIFKIDCNTCFCLPNGRAASCTYNTWCIRKKRQTRDPLPRNDLFWLTQQCNPDESFINRCNICTCGSDGNDAFCTIRKCLPVTHLRLDGYQQGQRCLAYQAFYDECNACVCGPNGDSAVCTSMKCARNSSYVSLATYHT